MKEHAFAVNDDAATEDYYGDAWAVIV